VPGIWRPFCFADRVETPKTANYPVFSLLSGKSACRESFARCCMRHHTRSSSLGFPVSGHFTQTRPSCAASRVSAESDFREAPAIPRSNADVPDHTHRRPPHREGPPSDQSRARCRRPVTELAIQGARLRGKFNALARGRGAWRRTSRSAAAGRSRPWMRSRMSARPCGSRVPDNDCQPHQPLCLR